MVQCVVNQYLCSLNDINYKGRVKKYSLNLKYMFHTFVTLVPLNLCGKLARFPLSFCLFSHTFTAVYATKPQTYTYTYIFTYISVHYFCQFPVSINSRKKYSYIRLFVHLQFHILPIGSLIGLLPHLIDAA